jgi:DNA-binding GntR family transcriptional regulator
VTVLTAEEAADIYEMRVALEALAAHRFVERATPAQVVELRRVFEGYAAVAAEGDNLERLRAKDGFYKVLFEGAASDPLTEMLTMLQSRVRVLRWTSLSVPGRALQTVEEMRAIVNAVEAKDGDAAAEACARHVRNAAGTALARIAKAPDLLANDA